MESGSVCGNFFILLISPTTKAVNDSYMNIALLNNVEKFCMHMVDIKNDYSDKDRLEDMVDEIIIEDEDADRHLIDMALQLSQQSEANNRTKYNYKLSTQLDKYNRKHGP